MVNLTADLWDKNNGFVAIVLMIFLIPFVLGFGAYSAVLILTTVTLKVLMAAAPLFIFCYMWDFLRETFNNWLSAILGNCLVLLFISLYAQVGFSMAKYAINMQFSNVENIFLVPLSLAIAGILTVYGVREGHSMGMTLARIAVEKAVDGKNGNLNTSNLSMRNLAKTIKGKLTPTTKD
nr:type IV secretion system protein [Actinobacillus delphinicola]